MREILIVEDSENDARLLTRALHATGVRNPISHASSGGQAVKWLEKTVAAARKDYRPVLAILFIDLKLPDLSGFEILAGIREEPVLAQTLRIVLSQFGDLDSIRRAYSLGAHSFLNKPAAQNDLKELIRGFPDYWLLARPSARSATRRPAKKRRAGTHGRPGSGSATAAQQLDRIPNSKQTSSVRKRS